MRSSEHAQVAQRKVLRDRQENIDWARNDQGKAQGRDDGRGKDAAGDKKGTDAPRKQGNGKKIGHGRHRQAQGLQNKEKERESKPGTQAGSSGAIEQHKKKRKEVENQPAAECSSVLSLSLPLHKALETIDPLLELAQSYLSSEAFKTEDSHLHQGTALQREQSETASMIADDSPHASSSRDRKEQLGACNAPLDSERDELDLLVQLLAKQNQQDVQGKDLVILLGVTDSGKSTAIHYFAGIKMKEVVEVVAEPPNSTAAPARRRPGKKPAAVQPSVRQRRRVVPEKQLEGFDVGHSAVQSETRSFTVYDDESLGFSLCDSPGLEDTDGDMYDIAMASGLRALLLKCRSARFVVLFEKGSHAGKGKLIKSPVRVLSKLFEDLELPLRSFAFFVTKVERLDEGVPDEFWSVLEDIAHSDNYNKVEKQFVERIFKFAEHVEESAELKEIVLQPTGLERGVYLGLIEKLDKLSCSKEQVKLPLTNEQRTRLEGRQSSAAFDLAQDLKLHKYSSASEQFKRIESLAEGLQLQDMLSKLEECKEMVHTHASGFLKDSSSARASLDAEEVIRLLKTWSKLAQTRGFEKLLKPQELPNLTTDWLEGCKREVLSTLEQFSKETREAWYTEQQQQTYKRNDEQQLFQKHAAALVKNLEALHKVEGYLNTYGSGSSGMYVECKTALNKFFLEMHTLGMEAIKALKDSSKPQRQGAGSGPDPQVATVISIPPRLAASLAPLATLDKCLQVLYHAACFGGHLDGKGRGASFPKKLLEAVLDGVAAIKQALHSLTECKELFEALPALQLFSQFKGMSSFEHPLLQQLLSQSRVEQILSVSTQSLQAYSDQLSQEITRSLSSSSDQNHVKFSSLLHWLSRFLVLGASNVDANSDKLQNLLVLTVAGRAQESLACIQQATLVLKEALEETTLPLEASAAEVSVALEALQAVEASSLFVAPFKELVQKEVQSLNLRFKNYKGKTLDTLKHIIKDDDFPPKAGHKALQRQVELLMAFNCLMSELEQQKVSDLCKSANGRLQELITEESLQPRKLHKALLMHVIACSLEKTSVGLKDSSFNRWNGLLSQESDKKFQDFKSAQPFQAGLQALEWFAWFNQAYQAQAELCLSSVAVAQERLSPNKLWAECSKFLENGLNDRASDALLNANLTQLKAVVEEWDQAARYEKYWHSPPDFKSKVTSLTARFEQAKANSKSSFQQNLQNPAKYLSAAATLQLLQQKDPEEFDKLCSAVCEHFFKLTELKERNSTRAVITDARSLNTTKPFLKAFLSDVLNGSSTSSWRNKSHYDTLENLLKTNNLSGLANINRFEDDCFLDELCTAMPAVFQMNLLSSVLPEERRQQLGDMQRKADKDVQGLIERLELQMLLQLACFNFQAADKTWRYLGRIAEAEQKCKASDACTRSYTAQAARNLLQKGVEKSLASKVAAEVSSILDVNPQALLSTKSTDTARKIQAILQACNEAAGMALTDLQLDFKSLEQKLQQQLCHFYRRCEETVTTCIASSNYDEGNAFLDNLRTFTTIMDSLAGQADQLKRLLEMDNRVRQERESFFNMAGGINENHVNKIFANLEFLSRQFGKDWWGNPVQNDKYDKQLERYREYLLQLVRKVNSCVASSAENLQLKRNWLLGQIAALAQGAAWKSHKRMVQIFESVLKAILEKLDGELQQSFIQDDEKRLGALASVLREATESSMSNISSLHDQGKRITKKFDAQSCNLEEAAKYFKSVCLVAGPINESKLEKMARCLSEVPKKLEQAISDLALTVEGSAVMEKIDELMRVRMYDDILKVIDNLKLLQGCAHLQRLQSSLQNKVQEIQTRVKDFQTSQFEQAKQNFASRAFRALDRCWEDLEKLQAYSREFALPRNSILQDLLEMVQRSVDDENREFLRNNMGSHSKEDRAKSYSLYLCGLWEIYKDCQNTDIQRHIFNVGSKTLTDLLGDEGDHGDLDMMFLLGKELDNSDVGRELASAFPHFQAMHIRRRNEITKRAGLDLETCLTAWEGLTEEPEKKELRKLFKEYEEKHGVYMMKYMGLARNEDKKTSSSDSVPLAILVEDTQKKASKLVKDGATANWTDVRHAIPDLLARVVTTWSVKGSLTNFQKTGQEVDILNPHVIQVLTIFRLFGLDQPEKSSTVGSNVLTQCVNTCKQIANAGSKIVFGTSAFREKIQKHLAQIVTGGGKSIVLGFLSTILALLNCKVYYACYSQYLSERDRKAFEPLWKEYGIYEQIHCSTLQRMVDSLLEEQADVRSLTKAFLKNPHDCSKPKKKDDYKDMPKILLIDEVDVFLSNDFFSSTVNPAERLTHESFFQFMGYVWANRADTSQLHPDLLRRNPHLQTFLQAYPGAEYIIDIHLMDMLSALQNFKEPKYSLTKTEAGQVLIGYEKFGTVHTEVNYGYKTQWAYFHELEQGQDIKGARLSHRTVQDKVGMNVYCGAWSYAAVPKERFDGMLGVTGTLDCMSKYEKVIVKDEYGINTQTITPSIFGKSRLTLGLVGADGRRGPVVKVEANQGRQYLAIQEHVSKVMRDSQNQRAVFIFFIDEEAMCQFERSDNFMKNLASTHKVSVTAADSRKQAKFDAASRPNRVTLFPRVFGRGVDFKSFDQKLEDAGGVHVIQTFYSNTESEEVQIKGRTARMGKLGSYELILNAEDLSKHFGIAPSVWERSSLTMQQVDAILLAARNQVVDSQVEEMKARQAISLDYHKKSQQWFKSLMNGKPDVSLLEDFQQMARSGGSGPTHWVFVVDHSGSMGYTDIGPESSGWYQNRLGCVMERVDMFMESKKKAVRDKFSLLVFSDSCKVVFKQVASTDANARQMLRRLRPYQGTNFNAGLDGARDLLQDCWSRLETVKILFLSDGEGGSADSNVNAIMQAGKEHKADVCIWAVKFSSDSGGEGSLKRIAQLGGGEYRAALSSEEFQSALSAFATEALERAPVRENPRSATGFTSSPSRASASQALSSSSSYQARFVRGKDDSEEDATDRVAKQRGDSGVDGGEEDNSEVSLGLKYANSWHEGVERKRKAQQESQEEARQKAEAQLKISPALQEIKNKAAEGLEAFLLHISKQHPPPLGMPKNFTLRVRERKQHSKLILECIAKYHPDRHGASLAWEHTLLYEDIAKTLGNFHNQFKKST
eukprot:g28382.t1